MNTKEQYREYAHKIRKTLNIEEISNLATEKIRNLDIYQKSKRIMIYYPLKYEINLLKLLEDDKEFYLPKVQSQDLYVCPYTSGDKLQISNYKISEPCSQPINKELLDLIIVPAMMADHNGYRLGYGKGFYDRFLNNIKKPTTLTIVPKELFIEKLPNDVYDMKISKIIAI